MPKGSTVPAVQMRTLPTATHVLAFSIHAAVSTLLPATTQHSCLTQSYFFQYITPTSSVSPLLSWHTTFFFLPPPCRMKKFQLLKAHISLLTVSLLTDSHRYTRTNSAWESTAQPGALQPEHQTELGHHSNKWVFNGHQFSLVLYVKNTVKSPSPQILSQRTESSWVFQQSLFA